MFKTKKKTLKLAIVLILSITIIATAQQVIGVLTPTGTIWYSCSSECLVLSLGGGGHAVIGIEGEVSQLSNPPRGGGSGGSSGGG